MCGGVWDRLPTKINLLRHGIIQPAAVRCVAGCGVDESAPHMFIHCDIFGSLWQHIRAWIGVSRVDPYNMNVTDSPFFYATYLAFGRLDSLE